MRAPSEPALYVADEDHGSVRRVALPLSGQAPAVFYTMGRPAQVLPLSDGVVLVTVRDPGMLLVLASDGRGGLAQRGRVDLPDDAWGVAVDAEERLALVTSAWTHKVTAVALDRLAVLWTVDVPREPRAVVLGDDGRAYVSHLVGTSLSRIDDIATRHPVVTAVELPSSRSAASASLGYGLALSPDGARLFAARHDLGLPRTARGAAVVEVLATAGDTPVRHLAPRSAAACSTAAPRLPARLVSQPRALAFRRATGSLLLVGEGEPRLDEIDARAPALGAIRTRSLARPADRAGHEPTECGAPSGLALSRDEGTAFVWCRASYELVVVPLDAAETDSAARWLPLADDPLPDLARARRRFYRGPAACASCHPEGRDDGFTWWAPRSPRDLPPASAALSARHPGSLASEPRQTPMLAGRAGTVATHVPPGWLRHLGGAAIAGAMASFVSQGLVAPLRSERPLDPLEQRGHELFTSDAIGCRRCHHPTAGTHLRLTPARSTPPSLRFVGGTAPYLHDGSATTLDSLLARHASPGALQPADRAALVAFLSKL